MKYYSFNKENASDFILNYIVINNSIVISYADKSIECKQYSIEEEKAILSKMKRQALKGKSFLGILNNKFEIFLKLFIDELILLTLFGTMAISMGMPTLPFVMGTVIFPGIIGFTGYKLFQYQKIRKDIKKHLLFIDNDEKLNAVIRNKPDVIRELDDNLKEKVLAKEGNNFSFTINTIDNMEYKELQQVYRYVEQGVIRNKPKTLIKRKDRLNKK